MLSKGRTWLWLYLIAGIILGRELSINSPELHGQKSCYQLNRFHCSFEEAQRYCFAQGGHLAYPWNPEVQGLIWNSLKKGEKWWIGQNLPPSKHHEGDHPDQDASYARNNSHFSRNHEKRKREVTMPRNKRTSEIAHPPTRCHQPAHANKILCHSISPFPSLPPKVTGQLTAVTTVPASQPHPGVTPLARSESVTHTEKSTAEITSSPEKDSRPDILTTHLQATFQNSSEEVIEEISGNVSQANYDLQAYNKLQRACEILQGLTAFTPRSSKPAQVSAINSLIHLKEQFLKIPFQNSTSLGFKTAVIDCLFHSSNNGLQGKDSPQGPKRDTEQVEDTLEMSLVALGKIQEAFLQQNQSSESSVTLTSSVAAVMLCSQNKSTLPLSSYTLGYPAPVRLDLPSASALEELLNKHPGVNVQVTGLAFNPFKDVDNRIIVGSIGSVVLSSNSKSLHVRDLMEDIEIMLWRNTSMEIHPTRLNMSTDLFMLTVDITSLEKSLIVSIEPESPLLMTLYLGFQYQPNLTHFHLNITLPKDQVWQKDEEYTWVLTPESLQHGVGTYLNRSKEGGEQTPALVSVVTAVTQCYFWDDHNRMWKSTGCQVKVTVLADNDPSSQLRYLIQVYTGYRRRAATTAQVNDVKSEPHHLCDPQKTVFERGGLDVFLLTTRSSLGELHSLRLWHDNSGISPSWYVNQVIVSDMAVQRKWHFLCNCWLSVDLGDGQRDQVFLPVSKKELFSFRLLFSSMIVEKFTQDYLWLSVITRHPWNQFTRIQRLTCCMTLLLYNMVINVMFWKMNSPAARTGTPVGPFAVTGSELLFSIQAAVILFPVNLVIGQLFPLIQSQETLCLLPPAQATCASDASFEPLSLAEVAEELKETMGFLLRRNAYQLSECDQSLWNSSDINKLVKLLYSLVYSHLEGVVSSRKNCAGQMLCDVRDVVSQLQKLQELVETHIVPIDRGPSREETSFPILSPQEGKKVISNRLPRWLPYICWLLLGVTSLASAFFTALYSLELNKDQATSWVISLILSVLQNIFISQPVKIIFLTFFLSLMKNKMPWLSKEKEQQTKRILMLLTKCSSTPGSRDKNNPIYVAPAINGPTKCPERTWEEKKFFKLTGDILVQILFLILLMTAVYPANNTNRFYFHQAIQKSFSHRFSEIKLLKDFYPWANRTLLPNLYGDDRGFITDGNSFLLGNVLLRQIRIPQEQVKLSDLYQEDTANYGAHWGPSDTNLTKSDSIWHHQNQETLGGYPIQGQLATYTGGGYVVRLGRNFSSATRVLQHLEQWHWLDRCTKSLLVEFVVFSANVDLFCAVTLIMESSDMALQEIAGRVQTRKRFISFCEAIKVNSAVIHLVGFLVLLATIQLWNLLCHNPRLQVISRTLSNAWDEVVGFLLIILILLTGYAIAFNLLFGWSLSDYQTLFSSAMTVVGLLMGISHYNEVITLDPVLGSFLILTSVTLMVLVIINLFVSAILMAFGKERKSLKKEAALIDVLLQKLSSLLGIQRHTNTSSEQVATMGTDTEVLED
ncbi:Polycystic kidney disease protein 1-like 3 [Tupaia chinensis]|uniref:Polycystic kidney disease protein 1-like 3 n=1 Tax=Tupaia chinensis TaxID=246437 RepID=L9KJF3_TUPCH|nr:Polycystic kidney disease protein 1-like 3 [Tupaia chinensis]